MKAVEFKECNVEIAKNQKEYKTLPAFVDKEIGTVTACFELNSDELKQVRRTNKIWLTLLTFNKPLQPIQMSLLNPFEKDKANTPFKIYHKTYHSFTFLDRIKILFGAPMRTESEICVDGEVEIIKSEAAVRIGKDKYISKQELTNG